MSANYYSQTPNFLSASSEDVDPRTRLFSFQHSLGQIIGNSAMGPELTFSIGYSATSGTDYYDLGIGIAPALTLFDYNNGQLSLASGESYTVDASVNPPIVRQNKMRTFDFIRISNPDGSDGFRVIENDGSVTDLTEYDSGIYVATRIYNALGYSLNISWDFTSWGWGIDSIIDDSGVTHLKFDHDAGPALTFYPGSSEEYTITLQKSNGYLSAISHSGLPEGQWQYFYEDVGMGNGLLTLTKTQAITGLIKSVTYNSGTTNGLMLFPAQSGEGSLPAVTELVIDPGFDQPQMITTYTPDTPQGFPNYLGYDAPQGGQWDASTDYVYSLAGQDYFYSTTLIQTDSDGQAITTTYTYNNYHLLSKLEVAQGETYYSAETYYYADAWQVDHPDTSYDDLPAQYQYPQTQTLTWTDSSGTRSELTQYQYDDFGNLTQQIDPEGIQTDYEYYSADGEADSADGYTGCPADPNGFANLVKSKKITPAPSDYDDVPVRATYTHYSVLDALDDRPMATAIVKDKESLVKLLDSSKQPLTSLNTQYYSDDKTSFEYGHIQSKNTTVYSTDTQGTTPYSAIQTHDYDLTDGVLESKMTLVSFDNISLTGIMARSIYSGKINALTDFLGTPHTYYYDEAGRFSSMITHEGNADYERKLSVDYSMTSLSTNFTNYNDNVSRLNYDALGRVISLEKSATEQINQEFSTVLSRSYDSLGRILYETITDSYLDDQGKIQCAVINIKNQFNNWAQICAHDFFSDVNDPEASVWLTRMLQFDAVGKDYKKFLQSAAGHKASKSTLSLNDMNVPQSITVYDKNDNIYSTTHSSYDGLKRLRHAVDPMGHAVDYEYDDFDRAYKTTYADGTTIKQEYAPHFSIAIVQKITVIDTDGTAYVMGTREIDGLGRIHNSTVGGRYEVYTYSDNTPDPRTLTDSLNRVFTYGYDPMLENALTSITADDNGQSTEQTYTYFKNRGLLDTVIETGQQENSYTWFTSGQVNTETVANSLGNKTPVYKWSVMNKPVSYTDIAGNIQWISYNLSGKDAGKPLTIRDPAVTLTFSYDEFGRLQTQIAETSNGSASLETTIGYDDYGREQSRTLTPNSGEAITITTGYYENNQISNVTITQGKTTLSDNQYYYDSRNRLRQHDCSGSILPKDGYGVEFTSQVFEYDCLNNIRTCTTVGSNGATDKATFKYINSGDSSAIYINNDDATQLTSITHSGNPAYPPVINLAYYDDGRLKIDEAGRTLHYDASGRLFSIETTDGSQAGYGYDGLHNLVFQSINSQEQYLYYRGSQLVNQIRQSEQQQDRIISGLAGNAAVSHEQL
ncbi:hypothetical protein [Pseudescherichia sp.]|uniref:RHS repeat domain-containing protein n=1 Tax=Pseudescherichia sp. TaxID=2055881 RepID=UPI00289DB360|nr:hypothetical protein [Pseudescherichia sp.]